MEFHERLRELKTEAGVIVFRDPDDFASVLTDVLAEDEATDGEISLLVNAVRAESVARLETILDSGADPVRAVEDAGDLLAQKLGTTVQGSRWAVAAIAYALGKVDDTVVHSFPSPWGEPTQTSPEKWEDSDVREDWNYEKTRKKEHEVETRKKEEDEPQKDQVAETANRQAPTGQKPKRLALMLSVGALGLALVGGGLAWALQSGGVSTQLPDVAKRYAALGTDITDSLNSCKSVNAPVGQTERLTCTFSEGTLALSTYETSAGLQDAREETVNVETGHRYSEQTSGVFFSQTLEKGNDFVYWDDNSAMQSATYEATDNAADIEEVESLSAQFMRVDARIAFPTSVEDDGLKELLTTFSLSNCNRQQTTDPGELEEHICEEAGFDVVAVRAASTSELEKYRQTQVETGGASQPWSIRDGPTEGQKISWIHPDDKLARIYWDDDSCVCFLVAISDSDDLETLEKWWSA